MLANVPWWGWIYIGLSFLMLVITVKADATAKKGLLSRLQGILFFVAIVVLTIISFSIDNKEGLDIVAKGLLIYLAISFFHSLYDEFFVIDSKQLDEDESFGFKVTAFLMMSSFLFPAIILGIFKTQVLHGYWLLIVLGGAAILITTLWYASKLHKPSFENKLGHLPEELRKSVLSAVEKVQKMESEALHYYGVLEASQIGCIIDAFKQDGLIRDIDEQKPSFKNKEEIREYLASIHSDRVLMFDGECIENNDDYKHLLQSFIEITNGKLAIEELSSSYDHDEEKAFIYFKCNGNVYDWEISQKSDWVSSDYFNYLSSFAIEQGEGEFLVYPAEDQCMTVVFLPEKSSIALREFTCLMSLLG